MNNVPIIVIYLGIKFAIKRFKKDKLSVVDFKKYEGYYREILKDYSPAELSYIDNFEILSKNDIAGTLLSLQLHKKISLDKNLDKIKIENNNNETISSNEQYVLDSIKDGKIQNFDENEFMARVKEDAIKNGLLKESKMELKKLLRVLILNVILIGVLIFICVIVFADIINNPDNIRDWKLTLLVLSILLLFYLPFAIIAYFGTYITKSRKNNYIRTSKGEVINERLEGLRNYLKDYSRMNERSEDSLILWEDYLIYSVIFNQNTQIIKSMNDKYI